MIPNVHFLHKYILQFYEQIIKPQASNYVITVCKIQCTNWISVSNVSANFVVAIFRENVQKCLWTDIHRLLPDYL